MFPESIQLYHDFEITEAIAAPQSEFGHCFGGPIVHEGIFEDESGVPVQSLCRLNTDDPLVPKLIPDAQWLPLYYCFSYENESMQMGYRVLSDRQVQSFFNHDERIDLDGQRFPSDDFPDRFPVSPLCMRRVPFDPTNSDDVSSYVNAFGIKSLSRDDQQLLLQRCKQDWDDFAPDPWLGPLEGLLDYQAAPACQGAPKSRCMNPDCANHLRAGQLHLFALVPATPIPQLRLWGELGDDTQILFEICPLCSTIVATNQCT